MEYIVKAVARSASARYLPGTVEHNDFVVAHVNSDAPGRGSFNLDRVVERSLAICRLGAIRASRRISWGRSVLSTRHVNIVTAVVDEDGCVPGEHIVGLVRVSLCIDDRGWSVAVTCGYAIVQEISTGRLLGVDSNGDSNVSAQSL
jgi:hypothetical protein